MTTMPPLETTELAQIAPKPIRWIWRGYIARGKVNLIAGDPGLGKSQACVALASCLTTGSQLPRGERHPPSDVLLLCSEDDPADTLRPRFEAAGANLDRIHLITGTVTNEKGKQRLVDLDQDLERLRGTIEKHKPSLLIVDALSSYCGRIDRNSEADVRIVLDRLSEFASGMEIAILGVTHLKKSAEADPKRAILGSTAWIASVRSALMVMEDPDTEGRRLLHSVKNNVSVEPPGVGFSIQSKLVGNCETSLAVFDDRPVDLNARQAMAANSGKDRRPSKLDEAVEWLEGLLGNGPMAATDVKAKARSEGIKDKTLRRAREELGIRPEKTSGDGPWMWSLPE